MHGISGFLRLEEVMHQPDVRGCTAVLTSKRIVQVDVTVGALLREHLKANVVVSVVRVIAAWIRPGHLLVMHLPSVGCFQHSVQRGRERGDLPEAHNQSEQSARLSKASIERRRAGSNEGRWNGYSERKHSNARSKASPAGVHGWRQGGRRGIGRLARDNENRDRLASSCV